MYICINAAISDKKTNIMAAKLETKPPELKSEIKAESKADSKPDAKAQAVRDKNL